MSAGDGPSSFEVGRPVQSLDPAERLFELERRRIEAEDRRTQAFVRAVELQGEQARRELDHSSRELDASEAQDRRRFRLLAAALAFSSLAGAALLAFGVSMQFFGTPEQRASAAELLKLAFTAAGGGGAVLLLIQLVRSALPKPR